HQRSVDLLGRVVRTKDPDGTQRYFEYDREGNVTRAREPGRDVRLGYCGLGRVSERREAGTTVRFEYDTEEQLTGVVNQHGRAFAFEHDAVGKVVRERGFGGATRSYERDAAGNLIAIRRPSGQDSSFQYDAVGRVLRIDHADGSAEWFEYRADGEMMVAANNDAEVAFERDRLGRVTRERQGAHWVASRYDEAGDRTHLWSSFGAAQVLTRDVAGDVKRVRVQDLVTREEATTVWEASFERDLLGRELERALPGGLRSRWKRDAMGRPVKHQIGQRRDASEFALELEYSWGAAGRLKRITDSQFGTTVYRHDELGNLESARYGDGSVDLRLPDAVGNLFRRSDREDRVYGPSGELLESVGPQGKTVYRYDAEGNRVEKVEPDGARWTYRWSPGGRLKAVLRPDGDEVCFAYDALGRRVSKTYRGVTTRWVWDGNNPLHEWREGAGVDEEAGPELGYVPEATLAAHDPAHGIRGPPLLEWFDIPREEYAKAPRSLVTWVFEADRMAPMAKITERERLSIVCDHLGSPLAMYDATGETRWRATWKVNGEPRAVEGDRMACPFRFPGQYEDAETGLFYNRFRYYDPESGGFISEDPIGLAGGLGVYGYVGDPTGWVDEFGLSGEKTGDCRAAGGGARFTKAEQAVAGEARSILQSPEFAKIRAAQAAGKPVEVKIGGRTIVFEPDAPVSGMTLFGEEGFVIGREAFASEAELSKTVLQEVFRLRTSSAGASGAVTQAAATAETEAAASFAERAFNVFFRK
ncbi:MAG: RHS repeat protein, partial [Myxococcales bacterium FL481]